MAHIILTILSHRPLHTAIFYTGIHLNPQASWREAREYDLTEQRIAAYLRVHEVVCCG